MKKSQIHKAFASTVALILALAYSTACVLSEAGAQTLTTPGEHLVHGSSPNRAAEKLRAHPFEPAEELVYVGEFSRALLKKVDVADFHFTARTEPSSQKAAAANGESRSVDDYLLKFTGDVSSKGILSKIFNLRFREQVESLVDPKSFSVQNTRRVDEQGKRARISESVYRDGKILWTERDPNNPSRAPRQASTTFAGPLQDVLSAVYYLRTQPLEVGKSFEIAVSDSGVVYQVPVKVVELRRMKTALGRVEVVRVDPEVFGTNRLLAGDGHFSIWLTNDSRHVPVSARIKLKYGTLDITLRKVIKNPPTTSLASTKSN